MKLVIPVIALGIGLAPSGVAAAQRAVTRVDTVAFVRPPALGTGDSVRMQGDTMRVYVASARRWVDVPPLASSRTVMRGDTLIWITAARGSGTARGRSDTTVALLARDTVYMLKGGRRRVAAPPLADAMRTLARGYEAEQMLESFDRPRPQPRPAP